MMDLATILGFTTSFGLIIAALISDGGDISLFIHGPSMLIVFGGTIGATLTNYPLSSILQIGKIIAKTFSERPQDASIIIKQIYDFSNKARRDGLISLEDALEDIQDPFFKKALQLAVDGIEPEEIESILYIEMDNREARHELGMELLTAMANYAPALGMIGTVIGLVQMLKNMNEPSSIGPAMAIALITTFYGAILANLVFLPLVGKLRHRSKEELFIMQLQAEGVLALSKGENPFMIFEKLSSYQAPKERKAVK